MRFLADESCDFSVVRALRAAGYEVSAVRDLAPGAPDETVIAMAAQENRVLLTEDKDFGQLVYAGSGRTQGVVFIRYPSSARTQVGSAVVDLVGKMGSGLRGRFVVVQPGRARVVELP
jgi:predicted nuclease of predicted toxin-antitoxin system